MTWVLLHGFTGAPASWDAVRAELSAADLDLVPETLCGHGIDGDPGSFDGEIDRLALRIARLGRPVALAGYSLGARVALGLCVRHPHLIERALLSGVAPGLDAGARALRRTDDARWIALLQREGVNAFCAAWEQQPLFVGEQQLPAARAATLRAIRRRHSAAGLALAVTRLGLGAMPDWRPFWRALPMEVSLLVGARDTKFVAIAQELVAARPATTLTIVPDAGHSLLAEAPRAVALALAATRRSP